MARLDPSSSRRRSIFRPTILLTMILVAVAGFACGAARHTSRKIRLANLRANLQRAEDRAAWSSQLKMSCYVSPAMIQVDRNEVARIKEELKEFEGR